MKIDFGKWVSFILLWILLCPIQKIHAQIPHGGRPLSQGAEKSSKLRSAVDYFVEMPPFNLDSVLAIDDLSGNRIGGLKFAHKFFVDLTPENSGIVFHTEDGTKVWKVGIRSSGAYTLNVLFNEFTLPEGAQVFLYNSDQSTVLGSFTNENRPEGGEFSVAPVDGDELTIEYHEPANAAFSGKIQITEVNHDYRGLFRAGTNPRPYDPPCSPDLSCNSQYDTIGRSVCLLIINGNTYCTGTLINNTSNDGTPYLITASHCFGGNGNTNSLETRVEWSKRVVAFLNYGCPRCDKRIRGSEEFSVSGSVNRAISKEIDFALLELTEIPPSDYRPYLAGWSLDTVTSTGLPFTCIHHPDGGFKKYSVEKDSVTKTDWNSGFGIAPGNHWNILKWDVGFTWGGSSGSPLFDKDYRFRGGLTGGNSDCGEYESGDYYYRFDRAWNQFPDSSKQLKHWLCPSSQNNNPAPIKIDGLDPYAENPAKRINNLMPTDSMGTINLTAPRWGSLFGHNSLGNTHFAEHFTTTDSSMIQGVYLIAAKGHNNSKLPVTVRVYQGGSKPGTILGKSILNPNYLEYSNNTFVEKADSNFSNRENYLRFDTPISVGTDFYVGYEIVYPTNSPIDSFYLYAAIREQSSNTAFFMQNNSWYPYSNHPTLPLYTSLWIEPVVSGDTITSHNTYNEKIIDSLAGENPIIAYSHSESLFYIGLPDQWAGNTEVEIVDFTGRRILASTIFSPMGTVSLPANQGRFFIVRLKNKGLFYVTKIFTGQ